MESLHLKSVEENALTRVYPGTPTPQRVMTWPADVPPVDIEYIEKRVDSNVRKPVFRLPERPARGPKTARPKPPKPILPAKKSAIERPDHIITIDDIIEAARKPRPEAPVAGLGDKVTISTVFYGGGTEDLYVVDKGRQDKFRRFDDLHMRFLYQLAGTVPWERVGSFRVALNDISDKVVQVFDALNEFCPVVQYGPNVNRLKYPRLREMWRGDPPLDTEAVISFDDDISFENPDWFKVLEAGVTIGRKKGAVVFGEHYTFRPSRPTMKWYAHRYWWKGKDPQTKGGRKRAVVNFVLGGAWVMLSDYIAALDWPDVKLVNNGGDVGLGMALWQNDLSFYPIKWVNQLNSPRRGRNDPHPGR